MSKHKPKSYPLRWKPSHIGNDMEKIYQVIADSEAPFDVKLLASRLVAVLHNELFLFAHIEYQGPKQLYQERVVFYLDSHNIPPPRTSVYGEAYKLYLYQGGRFSNGSLVHTFELDTPDKEIADILWRMGIKP